jgi:phospholipid N-methyltransferase
LIFSNLGLRIGAGTGIFTRALLAQPEWHSSINEIRAIEPSEGMRSIFSETVIDERVSINQGTFDATGIESGWADLIVVAQVCRGFLSLKTSLN